MESILNELSPEWQQLICKRQQDREELLAIYESVAENCTPPPKLWFEFARLTELAKIKIIIIGQDPYPAPKTAHGLAFSTLADACPDSLRNVYKCLEKHSLIRDYRATTPRLDSWAKQGILLLNTALSTAIGQRRAHYDLWAAYVRRLLVRILRHHLDSNLIIMCWGRDAQKLIGEITLRHQDQFHVLNWCHPSPLTGNKFLECNHFVVANEILTEFNKVPIKWDSICTNTNDADAEKIDTDDNGTEDIDTENKYAQDKHIYKVNPNIAMPETTQTITVPAIRDRDLVATIFPPNSPMRSRPRQIIFTDGSAVSNGARNGGNKKDKSCRGGYAAVFVSGPLRGELLGNLDTSKMYASNIRAEGKALIAALKKCEVELNPPIVIDIYTDSEFWINMVLKYMPKWNASKFAEKENPDLTRELWGLWRRLTGKYKINLHHVYSHNKSGLRESADPKDKFKFEHNAHADALASEARRVLNAGQEIWRVSRKS